MNQTNKRPMTRELKTQSVLIRFHTERDMRCVSQDSKDDTSTLYSERHMMKGSKRERERE